MNGRHAHETAQRSPERGKFALDEQTTRAAASAHTIGESTTRDDDTPERSD
ncbi:MAG TPA: hypothetical protein VHF06_23500 [Pseudonocardiaceae bacterium]|nr:hypothetical protein [Pseudonocardiaceae bacterium]